MLCYDSDIKADVEKVVTRSRATSRQKKSWPLQWQCDKSPPGSSGLKRDSRCGDLLGRKAQWAPATMHTCQQRHSAEFARHSAEFAILHLFAHRNEESFRNLASSGFFAPPESAESFSRCVLVPLIPLVALSSNTTLPPFFSTAFTTMAWLLFDPSTFPPPASRTWHMLRPPRDHKPRNPEESCRLIGCHAHLQQPLRTGWESGPKPPMQ